MNALVASLLGSPRELSPQQAVEKEWSNAEELPLVLRDSTVQQRRMEPSVVKADSRGGASVAPTAAGVLNSAASGERADLEAATQPLLSAEHGTKSVNGASAATSPLPAAGSASPHHSGGGGAPGGATPQWLLTACYGLTNLSSVVMIVVANKMVLFTYKFSFVVTLTLLHSIFTAAGMGAMAGAGLFTVKPISPRHSVPIAAVYVGFIVFNNLSIQINPLGARWRRLRCALLRLGVGLCGRSSGWQRLAGSSGSLVRNSEPKTHTTPNHRHTQHPQGSTS